MEKGDHGRLTRSLGLRHVFALSTGAMLSSGLFLLPGIAAAKAGPAAVLAYLLAGLLAVPAMLSVSELATALPKAGGAYYFLERALGPAVGTVAGFGTSQHRVTRHQPATSARISSVCWPSWGGGRRIFPGVAERRGAGPGCTIPPTSTKVPRATLWGCSMASATVSTGA